MRNRILGRTGVSVSPLCLGTMMLILDQIDELVAPGVTINPEDNSYGEAELTPAMLRRAVS
jgi:aryl-alcohol dehydrogenase-like predicted oxidoreductase